jgi:hypothetical protein
MTAFRAGLDIQTRTLKDHCRLCRDSIYTDIWHGDGIEDVMSTGAGNIHAPDAFRMRMTSRIRDARFAGAQVG